MTLRYATVETDVGHMLVAVSDHGIATVGWALPMTRPWRGFNERTPKPCFAETRRGWPHKSGTSSTVSMGAPGPLPHKVVSDRPWIRRKPSPPLRHRPRSIHSQPRHPQAVPLPVAREECTPMFLLFLIQPRSGNAFEGPCVRPQEGGLVGDRRVAEPSPPSASRNSCSPGRRSDGAGIEPSDRTSVTLRDRQSPARHTLYR